MPTLNRIQLIGRLGRNPEQHHTQTGKLLTEFTLAVDRVWKASDGEKREATDWFNIQAWGRLGEVANEYLHKGQLVFVEGRLETHRYEQGGETRFFTKVVMQNMQMLDRPPSAREADEPPIPEADDFEPHEEMPF